ncbi:MAG TPA: hypothetical protein VI997_11270 [Candidatus Thermoplasmatota archaeon]|nr:hypothetical protein [Candidatus Thermoplasmatota archaeon]
MKRALAVAVLLVLLPLPAGRAAEFEPDCRGERDAGADDAAILIGRPISCRGTLSGADPVDWYAVDGMGPFDVLVVPNGRADFDVCVFGRNESGRNESRCSLSQGPMPERLRAPEKGPWRVAVFAFSGSGEYMLTVAPSSSTSLQRASGFLTPSSGGVSAGRSLGESATWVEEGCAPAGVVAACAEDANATIAQADESVCTPPVTPGRLCTTLVGESEDEREVQATDAASDAFGSLSTQRAALVRKPDAAPPEAWLPDGTIDGRWVRLAAESTGREWATLAFWPNATVDGAPPEGELRFFRGQRELGACARVGFEECIVPWSADRALVIARGAPQAVGFELTYDASARDTDDCGSGTDAGDVLETALPVAAAGLTGCSATFDGEDRVDWYAVELQEAEALRVDVTPAPGTDVDACIYSPARQRVACSGASGSETDTAQVVAERAGAHYLLVRAFSGDFGDETPYGMTFSIALPPKLQNDCKFSKDAGASTTTSLNLSLIAPVVDCVGHIGGLDTTDVYAFYVGVEDIVGSSLGAASFLVRLDGPPDAELCVFDPEGASLGCAVETTGDVPGEGLVRHVLACVSRAGEHAFFLTSGTQSDYTLTFGVGTSRGPLGTVQTLCGTVAAGTGANVPACADASRQRVDGDRVGVSGCLGPSKVQRADLGPVWNPAHDATANAEVPVEDPQTRKPVFVADLRGPAGLAVRETRGLSNTTVADEAQLDGRWVALEEPQDGFDALALVEGIAPDASFEVYFFAEENGEPAARVDDGACTAGSVCRVPEDAGFAYVQATGGVGGDYAFSTTYATLTTGRVPDNAAEPVVGLFCGVSPSSC